MGNEDPAEAKRPMPKPSVSKYEQACARIRELETTLKRVLAERDDVYKIATRHTDRIIELEAALRKIRALPQYGLSQGIVIDQTPDLVLKVDAVYPIIDAAVDIPALG